MHWSNSKKAQLLADLHRVVFNDTHKTRGKKSFVYGYYAHSPMVAFDENLLHIYTFYPKLYFVAFIVIQSPCCFSHFA
jgi:predicted SnoaL-like aldol condensation-catalyzing enzyme